MGTEVMTYLSMMPYEDAAPAGPAKHPVMQEATSAQQRSAAPSQQQQQSRPAGPAQANGAAAGASGGAERKPAAPARRGPAKRPATTLELRTKAVFRALEKLLENGAESEEQLWSVARILSGDEFEQVAEERCLAGLCGYPLCAHPAPLAPSQSSSKYKISMAQQLVFERDSEPQRFCSEGCEGAVRAFAARLGSHAAAQHRFELLMRQARQGQQGGAVQAAAPGVAVSADGGAEGSFAAKPAAASAAFKTSPFAGDAAPQQQQQQQSPERTGPAIPTANSFELDPVISSEIGPVKGRVNWAHGAVPSQWVTHRRSASPTPSGSLAAAAATATAAAAGPAGPASAAAAAGAAAGAGTGAGAGTPAQAAASPAAAGAASPAGPAAAGRPGPKGILKRKQPKFAAGTDKTPIMLAQVQERDPSLVAADTARSLPADVAAAPSGKRSSSRSGPRAVEGYVPRAGKSQFKHLQAAQQQQEGQGEGQQADGEDSPTQRRRVRFSDEQEGGTLEMPSAAELAAAAAAAGRSPSGPAVAQPSRGAAARAVQGAAAAGAGGQLAGSSQASGAAVQSEGSMEYLEMDAAAVQLHHGLPGQLAVAAAAAAELHAPPVPTGSTSRNVGSGASSACAGACHPAAAHTASDSSNGPVLVFDIQDPQGPLEAGSDSEGLAAQFGELRVVDGAGAAAGAGASAGGEASGAGQGQPQPQPQPVVSGNEDDEEARRVQARLARLFPPLAATLPAELDAQLEAELASDSDADSAGWSSSSEEEMGGGTSSEEEDADPATAARRRQSAYRMALSFFGTLFSSVESWITDDTLDYLATGPDASASRPPLPPPSPHSAQIEGTLRRFLAAALPPVVGALQIAVPRSEVERELNQLLRTMRFLEPLPPLKATQWQVVAVLLLKALSLERTPWLRPAFESREGIQRTGKLLGALGFTMEEFVIVLELLCPGD